MGGGERGRGANAGGAAPEALAWERVPTELGELLVGATARGRACLSLDGVRGRSRLEAWAGRQGLALDGSAASPWLAPAARALDAYARGERVTFDLPLDLRGSDFERRVWRALLRIPRGETRTYGQVAASLGRPGAARAVGRANGANPLPVVVPCHRVVAADGLGGFGAGLSRKRELLELEGVLERGDQLHLFDAR